MNLGWEEGLVMEKGERPVSLAGITMLQTSPESMGWGAGWGGDLCVSGMVK